MLTSWKTIHTTLEYNTPISSSSKKKKKSKKLLSSAADDIESSAFGAQFVVIEDDKSPSNNSSKKRRKVVESQPINFGISRKDKYTFDTSPSISHVEDEKKVMLCVTTPHRAVFLDNEGDMAIGSSSSSRTSSLIENKTRSYVTKPGIDSSFSLTNTTSSSTDEGASSSEGGSETFSGMLPTGVQYHPSTNLLYGVRNSGCEIAIWSALPSSKLAGPDDTTKSSGMMNGGKMNGSATPNSKKRKPPHNHQQQKQPIENEIISERIHLPKGKVVTSLTPFSIPVPNSSSSKKNKKAKGGGGGSNNNNTKTMAIGATGCCNDGSIWIVSRFANQIDDKFQLRIAEGTSLKKNEKVLDSCISGAFGNISHDHNKSDTITLFIQSVILSNGKDRSNISVRTHKVRVYGSVAVKGGKKGGGGSDKHSSKVHLEKHTSQDVIELESSDVAVKFESSQGPPLSQLSIVHRKKKIEESSNGWMFTSVDFFNSKLKSKMSFPLPNNNDDMIIQHETIFSFGKLGPNIIALLMKGQGEESSVMSLRVLDYQRKAELSKISWVEGEADEDDELSTTDILNGKVCHSMVTNEADGSIALLTTSDSSSSSLDVLYSKLDLSSTRITGRADQAPLKVTSNSASLAATLRLVATSAPLKADTNDMITTKGSSDLASMITNDAAANIAHQKQVDNAVDEACKLLATSAKELIAATANSDSEKHSSVTNGKSKKGSKSSKKNSRADLISWKEVYQNSCNLIATATEGGKLEKGLVNGIIDRGVGVETSDMPKGFLEAAFKESATILLTLYKADDSIKGQKTFQKTVQEAAYVILEILKTNVILSRADYGVGRLLYRGNILLSILKACPTTFGNEEDIGKLHIINAMLDNVDDIHEVALVSILRYILRNVKVEDVVSFYTSNSSDTNKQGARLSQQYKAISDTEKDSRKKIETKLLSEALLSVASKIVKYSKCNHTFLTKAMKDSINTKEEVETLLLTFSKLLKLGSTTRDTDTTKSEIQVVTLSMGTIYWISALTDAHVEKISTITNEGGVVMERFQRSVRSAVTQSEFASEIKDTIDSMLSSKATTRVAKAKSIIATSRTGDTDTVPSYSMEWLNF